MFSIIQHNWYDSGPAAVFNVRSLNYSHKKSTFSFKKYCQNFTLVLVSKETRLLSIRSFQIINESNPVISEGNFPSSFFFTRCRAQIGYVVPTVAQLSLHHSSLPVVGLRSIMWFPPLLNQAKLSKIKQNYLNSAATFLSPSILHKECNPTGSCSNTTVFVFEQNEGSFAA